MTNDELAKQVRDDIAKQRDDIAMQIGEIRGELSGLKQMMTEGFDASRARDEELRDLMKFGLEAREVLRDEIHRRFDTADQKHDEQIDLLKTVIRLDVTKR